MRWCLVWSKLVLFESRSGPKVHFQFALSSSSVFVLKARRCSWIGKNKFRDIHLKFLLFCPMDRFLDISYSNQGQIYLFQENISRWLFAVIVQEMLSSPLSLLHILILSSSSYTIASLQLQCRTARPIFSLIDSFACSFSPWYKQTYFN